MSNSVVMTHLESIRNHRNMLISEVEWVPLMHERQKRLNVDTWFTDEQVNQIDQYIIDLCEYVDSLHPLDPVDIDNPAGSLKWPKLSQDLYDSILWRRL